MPAPGITRAVLTPFFRKAEFTGTVHSVFRRTVNFSFGGRLLTLAANDLPDMPDTVYTDTDPESVAGSVKPGDRADFGAAGLRFAGARLALPRKMPAVKRFFGVPVTGAYVEKLSRSINTADKGGAAWRLPPERRKALFSSVERYCRSLYFGKADDSAVEEIIGLGYGSTPSADDMILGVSALFAGSRPAFSEELLEKTTDISAKYLRAAGEGYYSAPLVALISDPRAENAAAVAAAGGYSGADTIDGLKIACRTLSKLL